MALANLKYLSEVKAGRVFMGSTAAAGVAFPIATGTAVTFGVWNTDPNKILVPLRFGGGYTSGTIALGSLGFQFLNAGLTGGATGLPISAYTAGTARNALIGEGKKSTATFIPATATLTAGAAAADAVYYTGDSIESASAGTGVYSWKHDFNGAIALEPGQLMFACSSVAQTGLFSMSMSWAEIPIGSF